MTRPKLKICLFSAPDRLLEHIVTRNMFLGDFARSYYLIWLPVIMTKRFQYCSRIYVWNWFTLYMINNLLLDLGRNQICVIWSSIEAIFWRDVRILGYSGEKKSPYIPIHLRNGGSGVGNEQIFKDGPKFKYLENNHELIHHFNRIIWYLPIWFDLEYSFTFS